MSTRNGRPKSDFNITLLTGDDLLPEASACARCGERRADWLVWDEDGETVTCATCGRQWNPNAG